ncbi:stage II sporulation E family protein [Anoxybacillus sp. B7M1]|jgi:phosphoserine phosphatase RsbU/P|uniref:response regulator n=1 Tax=unclassified Anoxybacillus TaxID=2639704 RepID=UPI0005CD4824|nr:MULTISPECIES: response regulator [unclassified Anoxybacillus]ANB56145.1 stage II sporulation E family protein [Anoxybacillus sp. B2M1]ANB65264.1 stage II sporulation E family protein [Anoxybacillus sp. B7M1]
MNIVVIEENQAAVMKMKEMLKNIKGISIQVFDQMDKAHAYMLQEKQVDAVLANVQALLAEQTERKPSIFFQKDILVVAMIECDDEIEYSLEAGAFDYIRKPFTTTELISRIRLAYRQKQRTDESKRMRIVHIEKDRQLLELKRKMEKDLQLARCIQEGMLPSSIYNEEICVYGKYIPSSQLSGDLYYWNQVSPHEYAFIVIDVMGHGVAAALVAMSIRSLLPGLMMRVTDPLRVVYELNRHTLRLFENRTYLTAFYGVVNTKRKTLEYVNAGHPPALLLEGREMKRLKEGGIPIGIVPQFSYKKEKLQFSGPVYLAIYTDGMIEATGGEWESYVERILPNCRSFQEFVQQLEGKMNHQRFGDDDMAFVGMHIL